MSDHYDRLENRSSAAREAALFRDLRHILAVSKPRVPALRRQLIGIDVNRPMARLDLAGIPVVREAQILAMQGEMAPLGGLVATRLGALAKVFFGAGGIVSVEGQAKDWWGVGRGLYAAGLRKGTLVLNCCPYDLAPHGAMIESGARAIGCPVIAAGDADLDRKVDAISRARPEFYCGPAHHLKALLDHGDDRNADLSSLKGALVTGPLSHGLRSEFGLRKLAVSHAVLTPELGLVAFESGAMDAMILNENLVLEIVAPGTGLPVVPGATGEIVVTRVNADYPLLRFGTGLLSSVVAQPSACGRTNTRLRAPSLTRTERTAVNAGHVGEIARNFPMLGRMRVIMRNRRDGDELHLKIEHGDASGALQDGVSAFVHSITRWRGTIEFVTPGTLSDEDAVIVDERPLN